MQQQPRKPIQIVSKSLADISPSEITSSDLSRSELFHYIFFPFLRWSFIILCLFIDALVVAQLYLFIPNVQAAMTIYSVYYGGFNAFTVLFFMINGLVLVAILYLEFLVYVKRFRKAVEEDWIIRVLERKKAS